MFLKSKTSNLKPVLGFTLIEILIVIAIIGILASAVLVGLGGARGKARDARRISDIKQVQTALELYYAKNGVYPVLQTATWQNLVTALTTGAGAGIGVNTVPNDPTTGWNYSYCSPVAGNTYVLAANLEDGTNPALRQAPASALLVGGVFAPPCTAPVTTGTTGSTQVCSVIGAQTNKYCAAL